MVILIQTQGLYVATTVLWYCPGANTGVGISIHEKSLKVHVPLGFSKYRVLLWVRTLPDEALPGLKEGTLLAARERNARLTRPLPVGLPVFTLCNAESTAARTVAA